MYCIKNRYLCGIVSKLISAVASVTWRALRGSSCTLPVGWSGAEARVVVPEIGPWNGGYLSYEQQVSIAQSLMVDRLSMHSMQK